MSSWQDKAIKALEDSLYPVPQELNTIDWKCALSDKSERLAQHICAFSNTTNGGFLAFGVNNEVTFASLSKEDIEEITNKLGNIAKNNLAWSVQLEHTVAEYQGHAILFIRIPEQTNKPIYLRGNDIYEAYIRSAGHTVKMSKEQELLGWTAKRELSKINYRIHTDAIKSHLIPEEVTPAQASIIYAEEADVLNVAMFGMTAKQWREANSDLKGNIRDYATINELICLSNMENINAVLINDGVSQGERLIKLNQIAIQQMQVLEGNNNRNLLK